MKTDILKQFTSLRNSLSAERTKLQARLAEIEAVLGTAAAGSANFKAGKQLVSGVAPQKKGVISAAGRARIVAAQKARWAKIKAAQGAKPAAAKASSAKPAAKSSLSAAARAKIAAAVKARWAKAKASGKKGL